MNFYTVLKKGINLWHQWVSCPLPICTGFPHTSHTTERFPQPLKLLFTFIYTSMYQRLKICVLRGMRKSESFNWIDLNLQKLFSIFPYFMTPLLSSTKTNSLPTSNQAIAASDLKMQITCSFHSTVWMRKLLNYEIYLQALNLILLMSIIRVLILGWYCPWPCLVFSYCIEECFRNFKLLHQQYCIISNIEIWATSCQLNNRV